METNRPTQTATENAMTTARRPASNSRTAKDARDIDRLGEVLENLRSAASLTVALEGDSHSAAAVLRYLINAAEEQANKMHAASISNVQIDAEDRARRTFARNRNGL